MIQTVTIRAQSPWKHLDIALFHTEPLRLVIEDRMAAEEIIFTASADSAGEPVVEVAGGDLIDLTAEVLAAIPEGATFHYNVWAKRDGQLALLQRGLLLSRVSIAPNGSGAPVTGQPPAAPLVISAGAVPAADVGAAFHFATSVTGGIPPYAYDVLSGVLPGGITLSATTGALSGTPVAAGAFNDIVLRVTDSVGTTAHLAAFDLEVTAVPIESLSFTASADAPILLFDGDSIMDYNATRLILEHYVGGQFRKPQGYNQARAGDSTQQILDGVQNVIDRIEPGKTVVVVGPTGANQGIGSGTFAEISAQQQQIYDTYLTAGAVVVAIPSLPDADQYGGNAEKDALNAWVRGHQTGGTVSFGASTYAVTARANFHAVDIGTADRAQTGAAAYGVDAFNPYTMKNDQTHPNGAGSRYLAEKTAQVLESLVASDIFDVLGTNLMGSLAGFAGSVAASKTGITGTIPLGWDVSRSGSSTTWVCSKDGDDNLVASVTGAGNNSVLTLAVEVPINGAVGDVFDMVVEVDVAGAENGFKGLRLVTESGTDTQGDADFHPGRTRLTLRSASAPLAAEEETKTFTVQALVEPGATVALTFRRAAVFYVETLAGALAISGTPASVGEVGTAYTFAPVVSGGTAPYSFALASGALPAGLVLDAGIGALSGTPTTAGTASGIAIRVTDAMGQTSTLSAFAIEITAAAVPQNTAIPVLSTATPTEGQTVSVTNGSWSNAPTAFEYRWRHSGNIQAGQTAASHVLQTGSAPQTLSAEVRAQNAGGWSAWAQTGESAPIAALSAGTPVPWDPAILNPFDLVFSDGDRTVSNTSTTGNRHIRGTQPISGKVYFEVAATTEVRGVGIADETMSGTQTKTLGVNCIYWSGVAVLSSSAINVGGSYGDGDVVQVAVDRPANLIWVRKNGTGDWNGNTGANPATGAGGIDISGMTSGTIYAMASLKPGGLGTLNGSAERLSHPMPAGFSALP